MALKIIRAINWKKVKSFFDPQMSIALAAIFLSLLSLFVAFKQMQISREQQYASALPIIQYGVADSNYDDSDSTAAFKMIIMNKGIGLAYINWVRFRYEDQYFDGNDWETVLPKLVRLKAKEVSGPYTSVGNHFVMLAGDIEVWFELERSKNAFEILKFIWSDENEGRFDIEICYSDI